MIVERNVFQLKFGASRSAVELWKAYLQKVRDDDDDIHVRLLTDLSGSAYVIIVELRYQTFGEADPAECKLTHREDWKSFYQQFIPLCEKSERTYYKLLTDF